MSNNVIPVSSGGLVGESAEPSKMMFMHKKDRAYCNRCGEEQVSRNTECIPFTRHSDTSGPKPSMSLVTENPNLKAVFFKPI